MAAKLTEFPENTTVRVVKIEGPHTVRLLEMGITPGAIIDIIRTAPLGFPLEIKIRGYLLSIRRLEAECIYAE